jgi:hypothetical protein
MDRGVLQEMSQLEKDIERKLRREVKAAGGLCIKLTNPMHIPDRLVIGPGSFLEFVETKKPGEEPRKGQLEMHRRLRAMGHRVEVIDDEIQIGGTIARLSEAGMQARPAGEGERLVPGDGLGENPDRPGGYQLPNLERKNKARSRPGTAKDLRAGVAAGSGAMEIPSLGKIPEGHPKSTPGRNNEHHGRRLPNDV